MSQNPEHRLFTQKQAVTPVFSTQFSAIDLLRNPSFGVSYEHEIGVDWQISEILKAASLIYKEKKNLEKAFLFGGELVRLAATRVAYTTVSDMGKMEIQDGVAIGYNVGDNISGKLLGVAQVLEQDPETALITLEKKKGHLHLASLLALPPDWTYTTSRITQSLSMPVFDFERRTNEIISQSGGNTFLSEVTLKDASTEEDGKMFTLSRQANPERSDSPLLVETYGYLGDVKLSTRTAHMYVAYGINEQQPEETPSTILAM